jgi:hypothetical protein
MHGFSSISLTSKSLTEFSEKIALSGCRFVDNGDQGVNDARWFRNDAMLVTASGNGRCVNLDMTKSKVLLKLSCLILVIESSR